MLYCNCYFFRSPLLEFKKFVILVIDIPRQVKTTSTHKKTVKSKIPAEVSMTTPFFVLENNAGSRWAITLKPRIIAGDAMLN